MLTVGYHPCQTKLLMLVGEDTDQQRKIYCCLYAMHIATLHTNNSAEKVIPL